jgi:fibronectin-binding autotransporter adhesin
MRLKRRTLAINAFASRVAKASAVAWLLLALGRAPVCAATYTWAGGGADNFWDSGANWLGGSGPDYSSLPTALVFTGSSRTNAVNRTPSPLVAFIDFANDNSEGRTEAFTLSGSSITLAPQSMITTTALVNTGTLTDTITLPMILNGGVTIRLGGAEGAVHNLRIAGGVSGSGSLSTSGSYGTLVLAGSNSFTGNAWVRGGSLLVPDGGVLSGLSSVRVGVSPGEKGTLWIDGGIVMSGAAFIASGEPASGTATVSSGTWSNAGAFVVGSTGAGTLNIFGKGVVTVGGGTGTLTLAPTGSSASSTLNMGDGRVAGTLQAAIVGGTSAAGATINFDHAATRYEFAPQIFGNISINHVGSGRTILTGSNFYSGESFVQAGTLQFARQVSLPGVSGTSGAVSTRFTVAGGATLALAVGGSDEFTSSHIDSLKKIGTGTTGFLNGSYLGLDTTNAASGTFAYASAIANPNGNANALGVSKLGSGSLSLLGINSFSGGVNVYDGTLVVGSSAALGTGTVAVWGGTLAVTKPVGQPGVAAVILSGGTISGTAPLLSRGVFDVRSGLAESPLLGSVGLIKTTSGTVTLTGSNSYTGQTVIREGTLRFGKLASLKVPAFTADNGATLALNVGGEGEFTAAAIDYVKGVGTGSSGFLGGSFLGFDTTNAVSGTFAYSGSIANPNGNANALGIAKLGSGSLVLSGNNSFSGGVSVQDGTLVVGSPAALGTGTVAVWGGVLAVDTTTQQFGQAGVILDGGIISGTGRLVSRSAYDMRRGRAETSLMGAVGLTKTTPGTVVLAGSNSYTGSTVVQEGTLQLATFASLAPSTASKITIHSGATLALNVGGTGEFSSQDLDYVKSLGNGTSGFLSGALLGFDTTNAATGTFAYASPIANPNATSALGIAKLGVGTLVLAGSNSFTGGVDVRGGTLSVGSPWALGSGTIRVGPGTLLLSKQPYYRQAGLVLAGGTISGASGLSVLSNLDVRSGLAAVSLTGASGVGLIKTTSGTVVLSGWNSYSGATVVEEGTLHLAKVSALPASPTGVPLITVKGGATLALSIGGTDEFTLPQAFSLLKSSSGTLGFMAGSSIGFDTTSGTTGLLYRGNITDVPTVTGVVNSLGIKKLGSGSLELSGSNSFTGGTTVESGTLLATSPWALGSGTVSVANGVLVLGESNTPAVQAGVVLSGGTITGTWPRPLQSLSTFQVSAGMASVPLTGTVGLTKTTSGTVILTGANSYSGPTVVQEGTLQLGKFSSLASSTIAKITVHSGATLALSVGGTGEFAAPVIDYVKGLGTGSSGFLSGAFLGFDTTNAATGTFAYASGIANPNRGANSLGLTKLGVGTLVLGGVNTFTGPIRIAAGTLAIGNDNQMASLLPGTISGPGGLLKVGNSVLTLSGSNSHTGTTRIAAGTLKLDNANALAGSTLDLNPMDTGWLEIGSTIISGTVNIGGLTGSRDYALPAPTVAVGGNGQSTTYAGSLYGGGSLIKQGVGTLTLTGSTVSFYGGVRIASGTLALGNPGVLANATLDMNAADAGSLGFSGTSPQTYYLTGLTGSRGIDLGGNTLAIGSYSSWQTSSYAGTLSGSGGLLKVGSSSSTLVLSGSNSYTGTTRIAAGYVVLDNVNALAGSTLDLNAADTGSLEFNATLSSGTVNIGGLTGSRELFVSTVALAVGGNGQSTTYAGSLYGGGSLIKQGVGTLELTGIASSFTGPVRVDAGMLLLQKRSSLYSGQSNAWTASNVSVASGATLALGVGGTGQFTAQDVATISSLGLQASGFTAGAVLGLDTSSAIDGVFDYAAAITNPNSGLNSLGILKLGTGTLVLSASNSYSGGTTLRLGTLRAGHSSAFGSGGIILNGGVLDLNSQAVTNPITNNGGVVINASNYGGFQSVSGTTSFIGATSGTVSIAASGVAAFNGGVAGVVDVSNGGQATITGPVTGSVVAAGGGRVTISGSISSTAGLAVGSGGVVTLGDDAVMSQPSLTNAGRFAVANTVGRVALGTSIVGDGSLEKTGAGTLALTGSSAFSGGTLISGGEVSISNGYALGTGDVTVQTGGTLVIEGVGLELGGGRAVSLATGSRLVTSGLTSLPVAASSDLSGVRSAATTTTAALLAGTASGGTLMTSWSPANAAVLSEVLSLTTPTGPEAPFVLSMSYDSLNTASDVWLGWFAPTTGEWVNAATGNLGNNALAGQQGYLGSFSTFQAAYGSTLSSYVGAYGRDHVGGQVWAVLNHNSDFAALNRPGPVAIDVLSGTMTQSQANSSILSGSAAFIKTGPGTLVLDQSNTITGATTVAGGTLRIASGEALVSSSVTVNAGAALALDPDVQMSVAALAVEGLVDLANGRITVGSDAAANILVDAILAGRGDGSWNGMSGINSQEAAAAPDVRAVGWLDHGNGSLTVAFAAAGDLDLNGVVDFDDVAALVNSGLFDTGLQATWSQGDFDYNGVIDFDDIAAFVNAGLYDQGNYNPASTPALTARSALAGAFVAISDLEGNSLSSPDFFAASTLDYASMPMLLSFSAPAAGLPVPSPEAMLSLAAVPEPSTWAMLATSTAVFCYAGMRRHRR